MEWRRLRRTEVSVTIAGLGAWQIAGTGDATALMGPSDDEEDPIAAIQLALSKRDVCELDVHGLKPS